MFARFDLSALSRRRSAKFVLAFFVAVVAVALVSFTARAWRDKKGSASKQDPVAAQPPPALNTTGYVRRGRLWPQLRPMSEALGDRLEKPGKERLILIGALRRASKKNENRPTRLVLEFPDRLRLEEQDGVTVYNDADFASSNGVLKKNERGEVESLLFDFVDHFLAAQMQGAATRFLGSRFRLDDGANPHYAGPFYELYQVTDRISVNQEVHEQPKLYFFNSDTFLLERVRYQIERAGEPVEIEVLISGWRKVGGQQIPGAIIRTENGAPVLALSITSAEIGAKRSDGMFGARRAQ
ncbi:MAG: hypothetical protein ACREA2_14760 [Blastocatellia bacterium]